MEKNEINLCIPSYLESLVVARAMVRTYLREHKINKTDEVQLISVLDELATNAIEHGYKYEKGEVKIVLNFKHKSVFMTVEDFGQGFDTSLKSKEDGGIGLLMARKLVDAFQMERKTIGTIFKVEKKIREAV